MQKNRLEVVGVMSGTSIDGVDLVLCEIDRAPLKIKFKAIKSFSFSKNLREKIFNAAQQKLSASEVTKLHFELGHFYANNISKAISKMKWKVDLIGLHGQTVFHAGRSGTLQIGEPSYLAQMTGIPVVSDFRSADISAGGEGAPLASIMHQVCFSEPGKNIIVQNLGGIGNLTFIKNGEVQIAFDTGPANMLIDLLVKKSTAGKKHFDKNGTLAAKGKFSETEVQKILKLSPFFSRRPPKSCGREEFGIEFLNRTLKIISSKKIEDRVATLTEVTAESINLSLKNYIKLPVHSIFLCGGGANNSYLLKRIFERSDVNAVYTTDVLGWPTQAIEGGAFALLAAMRVWRIPGNIPQTTGAKKAVLLGKVTEV